MTTDLRQRNKAAPQHRAAFVFMAFEQTLSFVC